MPGGGDIMAEIKPTFKNQNIVIEDRTNIVISGVEQVESFNDNTIILSTIKGGLSIKGEGLNVSKLNLDEGNVRITGVVNSLTYISREGAPKNLMGKIFK
jgi:sporulation protein YabP